MSSPTQYFWYRETLDISRDINTPQNFNIQIGGALFAAWLMIYFCLAKGIASSSKARIKNLKNVEIMKLGVTYYIRVLLHSLNVEFKLNSSPLD